MAQKRMIRGRLLATTVSRRVFTPENVTNLEKIQKTSSGLNKLFVDDCG